MKITVLYFTLLAS